MIDHLPVLPPVPPRGIRMPRMPRGARDLAILRLREAGLLPCEIADALDILPAVVYNALGRARRARKAASAGKEGAEWT